MLNIRTTKQITQKSGITQGTQPVHTVVFELTLIALIISVGFCQQLSAEAVCYALRGQREEDDVLFVSRLFPIGVIPNRWGGKFPALEEVMDGHMGGDNTPCTLFVSLVWAWDLQKHCRFRIRDLSPALFGITTQPFTQISPFTARKLSLSKFFLKKASYLPYTGWCKGTKLGFSIYEALITEHLRVLQPLLQSSS